MQNSESTKKPSVKFKIFAILPATVIGGIASIYISLLAPQTIYEYGVVKYFEKWLFLYLLLSIFALLGLFALWRAILSHGKIVSKNMLIVGIISALVIKTYLLVVGVITKQLFTSVFLVILILSLFASTYFATHYIRQDIKAKKNE